MKELQLPSGNFLMFDEIGHTYRIGTEWGCAERVPGLHEVLERADIIDPPNPEAKPWMERGKRVHDAIEQWWNGTFDESSTWAKSPERAYLDIYVDRFLEKFPEFTCPLTVEQLAGSEESWVATLPDQTHPGHRLLQIKTGHQRAKEHGPQLVLEGLLAFPDAAHFEPYALYIDPKVYADSGGFKLVHYEDEPSMGIIKSLMLQRREVRSYRTTRRKPTRAFEQV